MLRRMHFDLGSGKFDYWRLHLPFPVPMVRKTNEHLGPPLRVGLFLPELNFRRGAFRFAWRPWLTRDHWTLTRPWRDEDWRML